MLSWLNSSEGARARARVTLVVNEGASGAKRQSAEELGEALRNAVPEPTIVDVSSPDATTLADSFRRAAARSDGLVVAGGDGTIAAAVAALRECPRPLALLPLGTMNVFAHSLGLPQTVEGALEVAVNGELRAVDYAEVNGQVFLNSVFLGVFSELAEEREQSRGKSLAHLVSRLGSVFARMRDDAPRRYRLRSPGQEAEVSTRVLAVSNNPFATGIGEVLTRASVDSGELGVYAAQKAHTFDLLQLLLAKLVGTDADDAEVRHWLTQELHVHAPVRSVKASVDGEVMSLPTPLSFSIHPRALQVVVPAGGAEVQSLEGNGVCDALTPPLHSPQVA